MDRAIGGDSGLDIQFLEQSVDGDPGADVADADAEGAVLVMHAHGDRRVVETRVAHAGHGQQQAAGEIVRFCHVAAKSTAAQPGRQGRAGCALPRHFGR